MSNSTQQEGVQVHQDVKTGQWITLADFGKGKLYQERAFSGPAGSGLETRIEQANVQDEDLKVTVERIRDQIRVPKGFVQTQ